MTQQSEQLQIKAQVKCTH